MMMAASSPRASTSSRDSVIQTAIVEAIQSYTSTPANVIDDASDRMKNAMVSNDKLSLLHITTGIGKTRAVAEMTTTDTDSWLVNTSTHDLGDEFEEMLLADADIARSRGRRQATESEIDTITDQMASGVATSKVPIPDGACMMITPVLRMSAQGQYPAQAFCPTCPFGLATMYDIYRERGNIGAAANIDTTLNHIGVDTAQVLRCGYVLNQYRIKSAKIVTQAGTGTSATQLRAETSTGTTPRNLVIDEHRQHTHKKYLTITDINGWIDKLDELVARAREQVEGITSPDSPVAVEIRARYDMLSSLRDEVMPLLELVRAQLKSSEPDADVIWKAIADVAAADTRFVGRTKNTLTFEKVRTTWHGMTLAELDAPRRAIRDIITAANAHAVRISTIRTDNTLSHVVEYYIASPQLHEVLAGMPAKTIIMDATPSPGLRAMVTARGGTIHTEIIPAPVTVVADYTASVGRGTIASQTKRIHASVALIERTIASLAEAIGCSPNEIAVITHKPWAEACIDAGVIALDIGWWGHHERGHNAWRDARGLAIVGAPYIPPTAMQEAYHCDRALALMGGASEDVWPWWDDGEPTEIHAQIRVGDEMVTWPGYLPTDPILRKWVLDYYASEYVQAIGRLRSIRSDVPQAVVVLGPVPDLSEHGIEVKPIQDVSPLYILPSPSERGAGQRAQADLRVVEAMIALRDQPRTTYTDIKQWLIERTRRGCSDRAIARVRHHLAREGISPRRYRAQLIAAIAAAKIKGSIRHQRQDIPQSASGAIGRTTHAYRWHDERQRLRRKMRARQAAAHAPPAMAS